MDSFSGIKDARQGQQAAQQFPSTFDGLVRSILVTWITSMREAPPDSTQVDVAYAALHSAIATCQYSRPENKNAFLTQKSVDDFMRYYLADVIFDDSLKGDDVVDGIIYSNVLSLTQLKRIEHTTTDDLEDLNVNISGFYERDGEGKLHNITRIDTNEWTKKRRQVIKKLTPAAYRLIGDIQVGIKVDYSHLYLAQDRAIDWGDDE